MLSKIAQYLSGTELTAYQEEITRQNRMAIRYLAVAGVPLSIASVAAQSIIKGSPTLTANGSWMLAYFLLLAFANGYIIPENCRHSTLLVYLLEAPVMIVSILLGTVWDPSHQALTYLMFMIVMPVFVLDYPWRVISVTAGWCAVFLLLCYTVKDPATWQGDLLHLIEFFLSAAAVTIVVLKLRFDVIRSNERIHYHMGHDVLTGTRNRQSLEAHIGSYLQKPLFVLMGDLDQMSMLNDFYGREFGDNVLLSFSAVLQELFGKDNVYRYGGDELLCVIPDAREEDCLPLLESCRQKLAALYENRQPIITCSFSYVTGCPEDADTFRGMVQLSEIMVHKASKLNDGNTLGSVYDEASLRAGIVESNISTHLRAFETNKLTGLPGMEYFVAHSEELLETVAFLDQRPVVGYINLLRFQAFNDAFGYTQGDELARTVVKLLHEAFPNRHLAYLASGRFGVACYFAEAEKGIELLNRELRDYRPGFTVEVKAGFAEYHKGDFVISLLDRAKLSHNSIYEVKDRYFCLFDEHIEAERRFRQYLVAHLDEAIEKGWIKVYYQPIIRALSGKICNMEALSRWDDPQYGLLMPGKFISVLEEEWLVYKLSLHVVRQVLRDFRMLEGEGLPLVPVSVNLSRRDFSECDMVREITALMDEAGYAHSLLNIEITESAFMENPELLQLEVDRFRANGFQVWMDDFGSEYSTLNLLNKLSFDLLKIDMQFMRDFSATSRNSIIVDDVIGMSKRLGIKTLVEGVETQEQYDALRRLGGEKLQGFYFARPMPLEAIIAAVEEGKLCSLEHGDNAAYYASLGRINLHTPLSHSIPAAILELSGDTCVLIRENEVMHDINEKQGIFPNCEEREFALSALLPCCTAAIERAESAEGWVYIHDEDAAGHGLSVHARKLADAPGGATALLIVVLPG